MNHRTTLFGSIVGALLALPGCSSNPLGPPVGDDCPTIEQPSASGTGSTNTTEPTREIKVDACAMGAAQADIDKNLALVTTLDNDYHEMVVCGGLAAQFAYTLSTFFARLSCGEALLPSGFMYVGDGSYIVGEAMILQAKLAKDTSFGKAGENVPFDLLDTINYGASIKINATLTADTSWNTDGEFTSHLEGELDITVEQPKVEGLEMWGIPADGKSVKKQQTELAKAIGENVVFALKINAKSSQDTEYVIDSPDMTIADMYNGNLLKLPITNIIAKNPALSQQTTLVDWGMDFIPTKAGDLNGSITVQMTGGLFPYYAKFTFPKRPTADILVTCDAPAPAP